MAGLVVLMLVLHSGPIGASPRAEMFAVDAEASRVRIHLGRAGLLRFLGHGHEIDAPLDRGLIEVVAGDPARSRVDLFWTTGLFGVVPGTEPEEDIPGVEARMRGPEVLDVAAFPEIRFWSFEIQVLETASPDGPWRLLMRGGLELKGNRHTVEVPVEVRRDGPSVVATGEIELRLRRLGVEPPSVAGVVNVSNEFRLAFEIHARADARRP